MDLLSVLLIALGLTMDAFAVAICKGLAMKKPPFRAILVIGLWFGGFQALMPIIGYYLGATLYDYIADYDHWVAFILLFLIGLNMIREALSGEDEELDASIDAKTMLLLAVATSIDALAIGISLAMSDDSIWTSAAIIGVVTLLLSMVGVKIGSLFGDRFGKKAEFAGGVILIVVGLKVLLDGLGMI